MFLPDCMGQTIGAFLFPMENYKFFVHGQGTNGRVNLISVKWKLCLFFLNITGDSFKAVPLNYVNVFRKIPLHLSEKNKLSKSLKDINTPYYNEILICYSLRMFWNLNSLLSDTFPNTFLIAITQNLYIHLFLQ